MHSECEHRVIDEEPIDLSRPTQRWQQRATDMTDDRVVMAVAEPRGQLTNARCAGLLGDAVERRARKIEMERVERLVDDESRIVLHVVQICCARSDISLGATLAALPEFAVRIIVKFQADNKGILKAHLAGKAPRGSIIPGFCDGDFGVAQRTRDQRRRFVLQVQEPPDSLTVETRLCHVGRSHRWGGPG